jgi:hypothetical protein
LNVTCAAGNPLGCLLQFSPALSRWRPHLQIYLSANVSNDTSAPVALFVTSFIGMLMLAVLSWRLVESSMFSFKNILFEKTV